MTRNSNSLEYRLEHMKPDVKINPSHHLKHVIKSEEKFNDMQQGHRKSSKMSMISKLLSAINTAL